VWHKLHIERKGIAMSEIEPTSTKPSQIVFGKDGSIARVPENEVLLSQIAQAPSLSTTTLFKLVTFYLGYPTNKPLAKHLALFAAISFIASLKQAKVRPKQEIVSLTNEEAKKEPDRLFGVTSQDWEDGWNESGSDELSENPFEVRLTQIKWVSHSDVGLLVEAVKVDDTDKLAYHVVGISPDPATLLAD
jgi:hypothetical protein